MMSAAYIDTSCLLKLLFPEPESARVAEVVVGEAVVVVSSLTRLEAEHQIVARRLGGFFTLNRQRKVQAELQRLVGLNPFVFQTCGSALWDLAMGQVSQATVHCRTLDRLHLASMAEFGLSRLITHDQRQAAAARDVGFEVLKI